MRLRVVLPALVLTAIVFVLPYTALAQTIPFFGPIVPDAINRCPASFAMFMMVINNIIMFGITMAIVFVAPLMIAWAGFLYVVNPVNPSGRTQANSILLHTVVGIVIALAGWLIVNAVMVVLYKPNPSQGFAANWASIVTGSGDPCFKQAGALQGDGLNQVTGSTATGDITVVSPSTAPASEAAIRQQFTNAGVSINKPACNPYNLNGVVNGCTNVGNMRPDTVAQVIGIKNSCNGCVVTVTGGSEAGHASGWFSHGAGYKVDLRLESGLNTYLQSMESIGKRMGDSLGDAYTDKCKNNQYVKESTHWDITIKSSCVPPK